MEENMAITAEKMASIVNENQYRNDAVKYSIYYYEDQIMKNAKNGLDRCIVNFRNFPGTYKEFIKKYGSQLLGI
jgi:hypothetical protein